VHFRKSSVNAFLSIPRRVFSLAVPFTNFRRAFSVVAQSHHSKER